MSLVVDKALRLIELVADGNHLLSELVDQSELSRSTTHRLLSTLVQHGYLSYVERRYEIGFRFLELGERKRKSLSFIDVMRPELERYAHMLGDTLHLAILDGHDIILIERIAGNRELQIRSHIGQRAPAFRTAVGKALISRRPPTTWNAYLSKVPADYARPPAQLREDFRNASRQRYATDYNEVSVGTCGIASAFPVGRNLDVAVSINGATVYFPPERMEKLAVTVVELARQLANCVSGTRSAG